MSVIRFFRLKCDWCHNVTQESFQYSEDLKKEMRKEGWQVGNKAKCPMCLREDPYYWQNKEMYVL